MQTESVQDPLDDADEPDIGSHLREEVRQSLSNVLDMLSMAGDFWAGFPAIAVRAPKQLENERFKSVVAGMASYVEDRARTRWRVFVAHEPAEDDLLAYLVPLPSGEHPPDVNETVDFLGGLGIRPED